jgi:hypothetical protein
MFELGFESKGLSTAPQRPVLSRIGVKHPKIGVFPTEVLDTYRFHPYLVTEICCALRAAYPAGTGSVTILCSMPPNSRRVRWLSASSSQ